MQHRDRLARLLWQECMLKDAQTSNNIVDVDRNPPIEAISMKFRDPLAGKEFHCLGGPTSLGAEKDQDVLKDLRENSFLEAQDF